MTDKLLNTEDEVGDTEFLHRYQSTFEKIKSLYKQKDLESMRIYLEMFDKISCELIAKYRNSVYRCDVKTIKEKIHIELKNSVIDKYIKTVVNQEKHITKQSHEINAIKKMFENLIFKKYLQDDKNNEITNFSLISQSSPKSDIKKNMNINTQESNPSINTSPHKVKENTKKKKDIKSVESRRLKLLDIEAERIMNEFPGKSNKISQSPIHTEEKYISYSSKSIDKGNNSLKLERNSEKLKNVSLSPNKISRQNSKENLGKKDLASKPRNINKFINVTNNSMKKNSSFNNLGKPLKTATNRPVTPCETLSSTSGYNINEVKKSNSPSPRKYNVNRSLNLSGDCHKNNVIHDLRRSNLSPNKQNTRIGNEKNTLNYSKKMFNKYNEMLSGFSKKSRGNEISPDKTKEREYYMDKRSVVSKNVSLPNKNSLVSKPKY